MPSNKAAYKAERVALAQALVTEFLQGLTCASCGTDQPLKLVHGLDGPRSPGKTIRDMVRSGYALETLREAVETCTVLCWNCFEKGQRPVEQEVCPHCRRVMPGHENKLPQTQVEEMLGKAKEIIESRVAEAEKVAKKVAEPVVAPLKSKDPDEDLTAEERSEKYRAMLEPEVLTMCEQVIAMYGNSLTSFEAYLRNNAASGTKPYMKYLRAEFEVRGGKMPKGVFF